MNKNQKISIIAVAIFAAVMFVVPMAVSSPSHKASACGWGGCGGCCGGCWDGCGGCWDGCGSWGGWGGWSSWGWGGGFGHFHGGFGHFHGGFGHGHFH